MKEQSKKGQSPRGMGNIKKICTLKFEICKIMQRCVIFLMNEEQNYACCLLLCHSA
jgi:hypothetical protein